MHASLARLLPKLGRYPELARGVRDIADVTGDGVRAWIEAPLPDGRPPSLATQHHRRSLVRLAFRLIRTAGCVGHDPSLDVVLPPRTSRSSLRPLSDDEVERGARSGAADVGRDTTSGGWALAEATATTHEIPRIATSNIHLDDGVVLLGGSRSTLAREGRLTNWGVSTLTARMQATGDAPLAYRGAGRSPAAIQASCSAALDKVLTAAGLRGDKWVKPGSVRAWTGRATVGAAVHPPDISDLGNQTLHQVHQHRHRPDATQMQTDTHTIGLHQGPFLARRRSTHRVSRGLDPHPGILTGRWLPNSQRSLDLHSN